MNHLYVSQAPARLTCPEFEYGSKEHFVKSKTAKVDFSTEKTERAAPKKSQVGKTTTSAKGAALLALPFSLIFTVLLFLSFDISLIWAVPIYGMIGAVLIVLFLLGSHLANRD